ncbi:MAG TPA: hypothetical protein VG795_07500 [Acidimicrobiia bacterium]|nr:hypothetical protein [Acidimicrobiia bacterium]
MAKRKVDKGTRVILATAAVVLGLVVGIVVIAVVNSQGGDEPAPYQPFYAGTADRVTKQIKEGGPVCFPDPNEGERSFCLDLEGDQFVAYHVVQPGKTSECLVEWDRKDKRYEDKCSGTPVDPASLARFPVLTKEISDKTSVFVDVRETTPPASAPPAG